MSVARDGVAVNTHALNLLPNGEAVPPVDRIPLYEPNKCDSAVPGSCGCIHSEMNALVKAPGSVRDKVVFVSASPCVMCAKLIINSGVTHVFYRKAYRDPSGIEVLAQGKVTPVLYDKWVQEWR